MSLNLDVRLAYIRIALQADPLIGVGGVILYPVSRILREIVFLRMLLNGAIHAPFDDLPAALQQEIESTLVRMEAADA